MTINEQVALATDKVARWNSKRAHAIAMLTKWQSRLSALQAKNKPQDKPQPTATKLPPITLVAGSEQLMPRAAVKSASDVAAAQALARETALKDGILSIVAHESKRKMLMVRAPARVDIEHYFPVAKIVRTDDRDYLYRTTLSREAVAERIAKEIAGIDHTKVKDSVGDDRHRAYFGVWSIIMDLQAEFSSAGID